MGHGAIIGAFSKLSPKFVYSFSIGHTDSKKNADIDVVSRDVMRLTKINYNSASYNDGLPVTIRFANKVGEVLVMGSAKDAERQPFRFYI